MTNINNLYNQQLLSELTALVTINRDSHLVSIDTTDIEVGLIQCIMH